MNRIVRLAALALLFAAGAMARVPEKHALVVGIDSYGHQDVPVLHYAVRDAESMKELLVEQGYSVVSLPGPNAVRQALVLKLSEFAKNLHPSDTFLLFFAGHGVRDPDTEEVYWLAYDADPRHPEVNGIRLTHLIDYVNDIRASRKIVMLDHCYSGEIVVRNSVAEGGRGLEPYPAAATRNAIPLDLIAAGVSDAASGTLLATASRGVAAESEVYENHGLMTYAFLTAVGTPAADLRQGDDEQKDGALSVSEIESYLRRKIFDISQSAQKPYVKLFSDQDYEMRYAWKPFFRMLDAGERSQAAQRYRQTLVHWRSQQRITEDTRLLAETALNEWDKPDPLVLSQKHRRIVNALREFIDGAWELSGEEAALSISGRIAAIADEGTSQ